MISPFSKTYLRAAIVLAGIFLCSIQAKAQFNNTFQVAAGLTTMWITNDNPAIGSIVPREESDVPGAAFDGQQIGASVRLIYGLNASNRLRLNTGIDYYFLQGVQRNQYTASTSYFTYSVDMPTFVIGTEYAFAEYPPGNARIYAGLEARVARTSAEPIDFRLVRLGDGTVIQEGKGEIKENAIRLGGAIRLGIEGEIYEQLFVNMSTAYGIVNLFGRDNARGELLTPNNAPIFVETREGYIHNLLVSFLLQYRF